VAGNPRIVVDFVSDTSGLSSGFAKAEGSSSKFASSLKSVGKAGALAAGAAGVGALIYTVKTGIGEWEQSQKVTAQTEAVIKSTGKAAGVTTKQVQDLAGSIMKKTGIDDEAVQSGENLLLTFTNIRNETGKNNDIFTQATRIMTDMSVALGQDMKTSAIQLGKALNDPVKGMSALRRVGVSFTQAQQDQVKAMVAAGDQMGAQKLILRELTKEFGGSAEAVGKTLPGQLAIVRESFNNFAGDLVGKTIPYIEQVITYLQKNWPQISAVIQQGMANIKPALAAFGDALAALGPLVLAIVGVIRDNWNLIGPIIQANVKVIQDAFRVIADIFTVIAALLRGDWSGAWKAFTQLVQDLVRLMVDNIKKTLLPLQMLLTVLWAGIRAAATAAWNGILSLVTSVNNQIRALVTGVWQAITGAVTTAVNATRTAVTAAWNAITVATAAAANATRAAASAAWQAIRAAVAAAAQATQAAVSAAWNAIRAAVSAASAAASAAVNALRSAFSAAGGAASGLRGILSALQGGLNAAMGAAKAAASVFTGPLEAAGRAASSALGPLSGIASAIAGAFNAAAGAARALTDAIRSIPSHINLPSIPGGGLISKIPGLAEGGLVSSPTLALIGEAGPEAVVPLAQFNALIRAARQGGAKDTPPPITGGGQPLEVRVFIGDQELRGLVRHEVTAQNNRVAQTLLAGLT
jgi:phage-related protein